MCGAQDEHRTVKCLPYFLSIISNKIDYLMELVGEIA